MCELAGAGGGWGGSLACPSALGSLTSSVAPSSAAASASGSQHRVQSVLQAQRNKHVGTSHPRQTPQTRLAVTPASTGPLPPIRREPQSVGFPTTQVWLRLFLEAGKETSVVPHYEKLKVAQNPQTAILPFSSLTTRFLQAHEGGGGALLPSRGSSMRSPGRWLSPPSLPLSPDPTVFQLQDCLFSGAFPHAPSSPVLLSPTPSQEDGWCGHRAPLGRPRLGHGSHLPQSQR